MDAAYTRTFTVIPRVKFQNCPKYGIWKILKYYEPVLLPNSRSCYYLFIIEAEKCSATNKRPFFLKVEKNKHSS